MSYRESVKALEKQEFGMWKRVLSLEDEVKGENHPGYVVVLKERLSKARGMHKRKLDEIFFAHRMHLTEGS